LHKCKFLKFNLELFYPVFACSYHDPLFANFPNTLYMIAITFLSVGYGDFVPHTLCGRVISVVSGLMVSSKAIYSNDVFIEEKKVDNSVNAPSFLK